MAHSQVWTKLILFIPKTNSLILKNIHNIVKAFHIECVFAQNIILGMLVNCRFTDHIFKHVFRFPISNYNPGWLIVSCTCLSSYNICSRHDIAEILLILTLSTNQWTILYFILEKKYVFSKIQVYVLIDLIHTFGNISYIIYIITYSTGVGFFMLLIMTYPLWYSTVY